MPARCRPGIYKYVMYVATWCSNLIIEGASTKRCRRCYILLKQHMINNRAWQLTNLRKPGTFQLSFEGRKHKNTFYGRFYMVLCVGAVQLPVCASAFLVQQ